VNSLLKKIEVTANIAVILIAILLGYALIKTRIFPTPQPTQTKPKVDLAKLPQLGIDWSQSNQTLLLSLSRDCRFCTESAEFYRRLTQERSGPTKTRLIAVFPQPISDGLKYLEQLEVSVDEVKQYPNQATVASATPTLILVGRSGNVLGVWTGKLTSDKEEEVWQKVNCGTEGNCASNENGKSSEMRGI
jgi:hypothetical protein